VQALRTNRNRERGFTLVELIVVMMIIAILTAIAIPRFTSAVQNAKEAALKEDLHVMRNAIDSYTMDKGKAPQSLDDLVQSGYLKVVPEDPMTHSDQTWVTDTSDTLSSVDQTDGGIDDVHSGSDQVGTNGQAYSSW
jgi:general secretion pathway protein G